MVDDWLAHREQNEDVLMLATERATVAQLNSLPARASSPRGHIAAKAWTYQSPDRPPGRR